MTCFSSLLDIRIYLQDKNILLYIKLPKMHLKLSTLSLLASALTLATAAPVKQVQDSTLDVLKYRSVLSPSPQVPNSYQPILTPRITSGTSASSPPAHQHATPIQVHPTSTSQSNTNPVDTDVTALRSTLNSIKTQWRVYHGRVLMR